MAEVWAAAAITTGGALVGGLIQGNATKKAQQAQNNANAKIASDTNAQNWNQYLLQRGVNPGGLSGINGDFVNTVLPLGFTMGGQPAEKAIFDQIMAIGGGGQAPAKMAGMSPDQMSDQQLQTYFDTDPGFAAEYERNRSGSQGTDNRSPVEWMRGFLREQPEGLAGFQQYTQDLDAKNQAAYESGQSKYELPEQYKKLLQYGPETLDKLYGGQFFNDQMGYQGKINDARTALAGTVQQRINESRQKYGELNQGQLADIDKILAARTTGSQGIYDAELTQADTYANAVKQATNDELQRQQAKRAMQGFIGEGSGDALMRARTLAGGYQASAGARAQAGTNQATRLYGINDSDATSRFGVNSEYLKALTQFLDADARAAEGQAGLQNAQDNASVYSTDMTNRLNYMNAPGQLTSQWQGIEQAQAQLPYAGINSMLSALNFFRNTPSTPGTVAPSYTQPLGSGQIAGGAITGAASGLADYYKNQQLISAINGMGGGSYKGIPIAPSAPSSTW